MDILSLTSTLRRHWLAVLPIALLTIAGVVWALALRPPDYESDATISLLAPPAPPLDENGQEILLTENGLTDNPLSRFADQEVIVNRVSRAVSTDANRRVLQEAGAVGDFELETGIWPEAIVTAVAPTSDQAELTVELVAESFATQLEEMQSGQGIDPAYYFSTLPLEAPSVPEAKITSKLRVTIGVVGLGIVTTFVVVSIAEARSIRRQKSLDEDTAEETPISDGTEMTDRTEARERTSDGTEPRETQTDEADFEDLTESDDEDDESRERETVTAGHRASRRRSDQK